MSSALKKMEKQFGVGVERGWDQEVLTKYRTRIFEATSLANYRAINRAVPEKPAHKNRCLITSLLLECNQSKQNLPHNRRCELCGRKRNF